MHNHGEALKDAQAAKLANLEALANVAKEAAEKSPFAVAGPLAC